MVLDVQEIGRVLEGRVVPVQVAHPCVQVWVARPDVLDVALEVLYVDGLRMMSVLESARMEQYFFFKVRELTSNLMIVTNLTMPLSQLPDILSYAVHESIRYTYSLTSVSVSSLPK